MKLKGAAVDAFVRSPDPAARVVLLFGPDDGLVRERADAIAGRVVDDLADPFRVAELEPGQLRDDPARLHDEAAALAFTGGRRVVRLRPAGDAQADILKSFLAAPAGDALVIVEAGDLPPRSRLRRLFEEAGNAAALPCYLDEGAGLRRLIEDGLAGHGLSAEPAALDALAAALGADRRVTRGELDKLAAYMGEARRVNLADVEACIADNAALNLDAIAIAAAGGDLSGLERGLTRAWLEGVPPVSVLRAMTRHLQRLHLAAGRVAAGASAETALKAFRPRLHFRVEAALRTQIARWNPARTAQAMAIVLDAEIRCKSTGFPGESVCSQALMRVARAARH
ncbi:MAG: DNA polymerase III subunit delta [Alphaproteobacteria bacterium]